VDTKLNIVGVIPARYASTRLPAKPLVDLCGKPMVQRVVDQARQAKMLSRVIVATDDQRIADVLAINGAEFMMTPREIRTGSDRIAFVARQLPDADIIVNIQGDEPLIDPTVIDAAIRPMLNDARVLVATLVKKIVSSDELHNPNVVKAILDQEGNAVYFSRSAVPYLRDGAEMNRWHLQHDYYKHLGLYVFQRGILLEFASWEETSLERMEKLEQLRMIEHGIKIKATVTDIDSIPVDTAEDAERVRTILMKQHQMEHHD
jgi:3-deoxy-manno-octulosonate cytidylyltransferase (CMP-KDO synthetase)